MAEIKIEVPDKPRSLYSLQTTFAGVHFVGLCQNESKEQVQKDFEELVAFCDALNNKKGTKPEVK